MWSWFKRHKENVFVAIIVVATAPFFYHNCAPVQFSKQRNIDPQGSGIYVEIRNGEGSIVSNGGSLCVGNPDPDDAQSVVISIFTNDPVDGFFCKRVLPPLDSDYWDCSEARKLALTGEDGDFTIVPGSDDREAVLQYDDLPYDTYEIEVYVEGNLGDDLDPVPWTSTVVPVRFTVEDCSITTTTTTLFPPSTTTTLSPPSTTTTTLPPTTTTTTLPPTTTTSTTVDNCVSHPPSLVRSGGEPLYNPDRALSLGGGSAFMGSFNYNGNGPSGAWLIVDVGCFRDKAGKDIVEWEVGKNEGGQVWVGKPNASPNQVNPNSNGDPRAPNWVYVPPQGKRCGMNLGNETIPQAVNACYSGGGGQNAAPNNLDIMNDDNQEYRYIYFWCDGSHAGNPPGEGSCDVDFLTVY